MEVGRRTPRISFSSLCEFITASDTRRLTILRQQKRPRPFVFANYSNALRQIQDYAVDQRPLDPSDARLEAHEQEVIAELLGRDWLEAGITASRPDPRQTLLTVRGVEISIYPDLVLHAGDGPNRRAGALKFHFAKTRDLDPEVGKWMASLLYQHHLGMEQASGADPELCMVYDIRQDQHHKAGKTHKRLFQNIDSACRFIAAIWGAV